METIPLCRREGCGTTPRYGYADSGLCLRDERIGLEAVRELPRLFMMLGGLWFDRPAPKWSNTNRVFGPSDPLNTHAIDLQWEIGWMLDQWTEIVADRGGLTEDWAILDRHYLVLLGVPPWPIVQPDRSIVDMDGIDGVIALTRLHARAAVVDPDAERIEEVPGVCGGCRRASLRHKIKNNEYVWCENCGTTVAWSAYHEAQTFLVAA